jgi:hypothetical protein
MSKGWAISNLTVKLSWKQFIGRYVAQPHVWRCKADYLDHVSREGDDLHWLYSCGQRLVISPVAVHPPKIQYCKFQSWIIQ